MFKYALALAAAFAFATPAVAQHAHGNKGPNGGIMEDIAGVHAEMLASGNTITVNILDEGGKPLASKGYTATALVIRVTEREPALVKETGGEGGIFSSWQEVPINQGFRGCLLKLCVPVRCPACRGQYASLFIGNVGRTKAI